jgi:metal-responsive CopG/Arc/MetJ family transcriptional regulator
MKRILAVYGLTEDTINKIEELHKSRKKSRSKIIDDAVEFYTVHINDWKNKIERKIFKGPE